MSPEELKEESGEPTLAGAVAKGSVAGFPVPLRPHEILNGLFNKNPERSIQPTRFIQHAPDVNVRGRVGQGEHGRVGCLRGYQPLGSPVHADVPREPLLQHAGDHAHCLQLRVPRDAAPGHLARRGTTREC